MSSEDNPFADSGNRFAARPGTPSGEQETLLAKKEAALRAKEEELRQKEAALRRKQNDLPAVR